MARRKKLLDLAGTGDDGTTGLLGGGRAAKDDPRVEAFGTVDEASSALGLAKSLTVHPRVRSICDELQRGLYAVGAELGTNPDVETVFVTTSPADVERLEELTAGLEAEVAMPKGFILPGATPASGALDLARAVVRRAERRSLSLRRAGGLSNDQVVRWLNRLSLLLFVLGRYEEELAGRRAQPAKRTRAH
jgi:cob(I)alamin adenosyltransferase